ncbi:MAG: class I SAM-dependent methyltransferase [Actinomycetota bacterium]
MPRTQNAATADRICLAERPMPLDAFIERAEAELLPLQLPKPPLWYVAQDGVANDRPDGLWLEFGTGSATTTKMLCAARQHGNVYTFDSFEGLPADWNDMFRKGAFRFDRPLDLPDNGVVVPGLFADTLPAFLDEHPGPIDLLHIDCDIYSSTRDVLTSVSDRIVPGTVIVFDELLYYPDRADHEVKAFYEWLQTSGAAFEWIGINGTKRALDWYAIADSDPSRASEVFVDETSRIVRFDVALNERVALRIVD